MADSFPRKVFGNEEEFKRNQSIYYKYLPLDFDFIEAIRSCFLTLGKGIFKCLWELTKTLNLFLTKMSPIIVG